MEPSKLLILLTSLVAVGLAAKFPIQAPNDIVDKPLSDDMINFINGVGASWTAGRNFPPETDPRILKKLCGTVLPSRKSRRRLPERRHSLKGLKIPDEFDSRTNWPECPSLKEIRDQGACGSCWAISVAAAMTDRWCIGTNGEHFRFSTQDILSCCWTCGSGCGGGNPAEAWNYLVTNGVVSGGPFGSEEGCSPYEIPPTAQNVSTPKCRKTCEDSYDKTYTEDLHFARRAYMVPTSTEQMQLEIMENGPVVGAMLVYEDFIMYRTGVYHHVTGDLYGGHAIKILGWGVEEGTPYWLVANSWNATWGDGGYFKILRGSDECSIEEFITAGLPKV